MTEKNERCQKVIQRIQKVFDLVNSAAEQGVVDPQRNNRAHYSDGSRIILEGSVPNQETLDRLVEVASMVDGTKSVDTQRLAIASN